MHSQTDDMSVLLKSFNVNWVLLGSVFFYNSAIMCKHCQILQCQEMIESNN